MNKTISKILPKNANSDYTGSKIAFWVFVKKQV